MTDRADSPGAALRQSLRRAADSALALVQVRMELVNTELQLGAQAAFRAGVQVGIACLLLLLGLVCALGFVVWLTPAEARVWVLGGMALLLCGAGIGLLRQGHATLRQGGGPFSASLRELQRDREHLAAERE